MEIANVIMDPGVALAGVATAAIAAMIVWWLIRKRQKRVWLPTVRIMRLESRTLPRLVFRPPPLLGFLCFVACAAALLGFAMRPRTQIFTPFEPNQTRIHVLVDLSASVSAHVSLDAYVQRVLSLYASVKESGRVSFSSSHGPQLHEPANAQELEAWLRATGFHRGGVRLGAALKILLEELGEVDRLFLMGDRDLHSWTGFNWSYLLDEMDVRFVDVAGAARGNLFINDVRYLPTASQLTMEWDVEIGRRAPGDAATGRLTVSYMGQDLGHFPWVMASDKQRLNLVASWPTTAIEEILAGAGGGDDVPLVFRLEVDGGDSLVLDNEFRANVRGLRSEVLVVSETPGERMLEDPVGQLGTALEVLGFKVKRQDLIKQPGPKPEEQAFLVLAAGPQAKADSFCPRSYEVARLAAREKRGARAARPTPKVWLMPGSLDAPYDELCVCYARLLKTTRSHDERPAYCDHVASRQHWLDLLPSLGAKQIGGQLGDVDSTLAWHGRDQASGIEVLAFTVPLAPLRATGINHAHLPVLVQQLAQWQGFLGGPGGGAQASWPRLEDVVETQWQASRTPESVEPLALMRLRQSNVPLGESLLAEIEDAQLPPRWTAQVDWTDKQLPVKKDREDPLPWLRLTALIVIAFMALEALFGLGTRLFRLLGRRPEASALLLFLMLGLAGGRAEARVGFCLVGYPTDQYVLAALARETAHRTSIELEVKPGVYGTLTSEALQQPWLWVHDLGAITQDGRLKPEVSHWVKRGGFLVIESPMSDEQAARLTEALVGPAAGWSPVPPDHELMRSFYLLDALPACNDRGWRAFHYDDRLAVLAIPYGFLMTVKDRPVAPNCAVRADQERSVRTFVNLMMVALATDYKKDQIHLPEILKRLR